MKVQYHVAFSAAFSGAIYAFCGSWQIAVSSLLAGIFIDVDHVIDYVIQYGLVLDLEAFFKSFEDGAYKRIYIFMHGWEWIVAGAIAAYLSGWNPWIVGITLGCGQHLVFDHCTNKLGTWAYSFFWRCGQRFSTENL